MYVIGNRHDADEFWSNDDGWVDLDSADRFSADEQRSLFLPVDGYWVSLWAVDGVQFARLLSECEAAGLLELDGLQIVADSMDCEVTQVQSLLERASNLWDKFKANGLYRDL